MELEKLHNFTLIKSFFEFMTAKEYYNFIIDTLQLPDFPKPSTCNI